MSHSKHTKRGYSLHLEKWNRESEKYINTCAMCGFKGYSPTIEQDEFKDNITYRELVKTLPRLELDELGRCSYCARIQDKNI